ncbi:hypothetical protein [Salisaeta longa]|uniref:hypothetical protein n=1 Tax=Salisaeta longa TaxID=503170 RepID=UPI0003B42B64|nr:hypothetical protein [Salisaeta longa]
MAHRVSINPQTLRALALDAEVRRLALQARQLDALSGANEYAQACRGERLTAKPLLWKQMASTVWN